MNIVPAFSISYRRFSRNMQKNFKLAVAVIALLLLYRVFLFLYFRETLGSQLMLSDYLAAFLNGLRYDAVVAGYVTGVPMMFGLVSLFMDIDRVNGGIRSFFLYFFAVSSVVMMLSHFLFFLEFHHNFDHLALGAVYDDRTAVLMTAWHQYPLGKALLGIVVGVGAFIWLTRYFIKKPFFPRENSSPRPVAVNVALGLLWIVLYLAMIRGSAGPRPVEPKDAAVTKDPHLNSHIVNPFMALAYTVEGHFKMMKGDGIDAFLTNGTIAQAAGRFFNHSAHRDLDTLMLRHAKGSATRPRHLFLIIMESMDAWDLLDKYRSFDLLPNLRSLGREGILLQKFLSASTGTMGSVAAIITGLPDAHVMTNYQPSSQKPYPTSIAPIFKQLGYRTRFFYGGYLSWQRLQDFCQGQGFDDIYGGASMGPWRSREWGIDDEGLFDFVSKNIDDQTPSFNVILSTTYHSPYNIDLYQWGFPYKTFPEALKDMNPSVGLKVFGHLWYSDKILGNFIRAVQSQHPASIFAVTGDHRSHNYINVATTDFYEQSAVPLLIYGMDLKWSAKACLGIAGSHLDIAPTLIERSAPEGFMYHSLGSDLLDPQRTQRGIGRDTMITPEVIADLRGNVSPLPAELRPQGTGTEQPDCSRCVQAIRDWYALGWWRIMRGSALSSANYARTTEAESSVQ